MAGTRTMGTTLTMKKAGDEQADTVIAHLTSIGEVTGEREEIDVTTLDSPNGAKEFISGVVDFGSFDVAGNVIDGVQVSALWHKVSAERILQLVWLWRKNYRWPRYFQGNHSRKWCASLHFSKLT